MNDRIPPFLERRRHLEQVIAEYLESLSSGEECSRETWLLRYPELETELAEFFHNQDLVDSVAAPLRPARGASFGSYELIRQVGCGGMGVVYLARQRGLDRIVALKMVLEGHLASKSARLRFQTEARAAARLQSRNIVSIFDVGTHNGSPYYSMEFIEGPALSERLDSANSSLTLRESIDLVRQLARALEHAHGMDVIHRDVKPSNIIMHPERGPVLVDFGLALDHSNASRMTQQGELLGTLNYMSPEQFRGVPEEIGSPSDIYSLGVILYRLCAGRLPHAGGSPSQVMNQILHIHPDAPSAYRSEIPPELDAICLRALAKNTAERFTTMAEFATALDALKLPSAEEQAGNLSGKSSTDRSSSSFPSKPSRPLNERKRNGWSNRYTAVMGLVFLGSIAITGWLGGWFSSGVRDEPEIVESLPEFRAQLPPVGSWTKLTGHIWHQGLAGSLPMHFAVEIRCVGESALGKRRFRDLEIDVSTDGYREQASLRVDLDQYREGIFGVVDGVVMADGAYPDNGIWARFDPDRDTIAREFELHGKRLPERRLSTHDVLALLFKADVKATVNLFPLVHDYLQELRHVSGSELILHRQERAGNHCTVIKTPPAAVGQESQISYTIMLSDEVPFTWYWADIALNQQGPLFNASLSCEASGQNAVRRFDPPPMLEPPPSPPVNPIVANFRAALPDVGGKAIFQGRITYGDLDIDYVIDLRIVDSEVVDGRACRVLEIDVQTGEFRERARLLIDVQRYQNDGLFSVVSGYVIAGTRHDDENTITVDFDPLSDLVALKHGWMRKPLPEERLSIHDVVAMLFKARVKTSVEVFGSLHGLLRNERTFEGKGLIVDESALGQRFRTDEPLSDDVGSVKYEIVLDPDKPFSWMTADISYSANSDQSVRFAASLQRTSNGPASVAEATLPPTKPAGPESPRYMDLAYLNLPVETGSYASFAGIVSAGPVLMEIDRMTIRVLNGESVDGVDYQWIEIKIRTGAEDDPNRITEIARLLVDLKLYRNERKLRIRRGWVQLMYGPHDIVVPIEHDQALLAEYLDRLDVDSPRITRLPIRDALSLLLGADVETSLPHVTTIRRQIIDALLDENLQRDVGVGTVRVSSGGELEDLSCKTISPLGEIPLESSRLAYKIYLPQDDEEFPFGWARIDLTVRLPSEVRLFSAQLRVREFGTSESVSDASEELLEERWRDFSRQVRASDPQEVKAREYLALMERLASPFESSGRFQNALKWYERVVRDYPGTLAAEEARTRIDSIRTRIGIPDRLR